VLTALPPGEDGSPPGPARAKDEQYVAMSWRLARDFELEGSGLHSRPLPPLLEGYQANGPLSQLRVPELAEDAGEDARQWLLDYWENPGAATWLDRADTMDRETRLSDALGLPLRTEHSCNLCFVCDLAGEGTPPVYGLVCQKATDDHRKKGAHTKAVELAKAGEAGVSASNVVAEAAEKCGKERGRQQFEKRQAQRAAKHPRLAVELQHSEERERLSRLATQQEVLNEVETNGLKLELVPDRWKGERAVVLAAVNENGLALEHARLVLQGDKQVVLTAVTKNGLALQYAQYPARGDEEVMSAAVQQSACSLCFLHNFQNREVAIEALQIYPEGLQNVSVDLRIDHGVVLAAAQVLAEDNSLDKLFQHFLDQGSLLTLLEDIEFNQKWSEQSWNTNRCTAKEACRRWGPRTIQELLEMRAQRRRQSE
jgi:hypothetical protein